jgi:hypothetical protein
MGKDSEADEGVVESKLERSDMKPLQKIDSFASTASSKTTLQPCLGRHVTMSNANMAAAQNVFYPVILIPHAVQNSGFVS